MNIAERLTRDMIDQGVTVVLRDGTSNATVPAVVEGWVVRNGEGSGVAVFGPYPQSVHATGVRVLYKDASEDDAFKTPLALPAGQTYRYTLTMGVS